MARAVDVDALVGAADGDQDGDWSLRLIERKMER
jgi:hypothetical protein